MTKQEKLSEAIRYQEWLICNARRDLARAEELYSEVSVREYRAHLKSLLDHYDQMTGAAA
jgi:hypothetical protein